MKHKVITAENYREFKPSEFIHSFISDIEVARKKGKPMDMDTYSYSPNGTCLPCLGGMACLNMNLNPYEGRGSIADLVSYLGEYIRIGDTCEVISYVNQLFDLKLDENASTAYKPRIKGVVKTKKQFGELTGRVMYYVNYFEKLGY